MRNLARADSAKIVSLSYCGANRIVTTDAVTVGDLLTRLDLHPGAKDLVEPGASTTIPNGFYNVNVYCAQPYRIVDGAKVTLVQSAQHAPTLIAADGGVTIYPEDKVTLAPVDDFVQAQVVGQDIVVERAKLVHVTADGEAIPLRTRAATIGDFLSEKGIQLGEKDTVEPGLATPISEGLAIKVTRVAVVVTTKDEPIPRTTQTTNDPTITKGVTQVTDEGADGQQKVTYELTYNNGVVVKSRVLATVPVTPARPRTQIVGTKQIFAGSVEYWRPLVIDAANANGVDPNKMLRIMQCESGGSATASNGTHFGLFQYDMQTWYGVGGNSDNIWDGPTQITKTAWKMGHYGFSAWVCQ